MGIAIVSVAIVSVAIVSVVYFIASHQVFDDMFLFLPTPLVEVQRGDFTSYGSDFTFGFPFWPT